MPFRMYQCIGSKYCKCRVYLFHEFRSLQTSLLADKSDPETITLTKTIDLKDRHTALGPINFRNSSAVQYKANTKPLAAAFSIDKEENVLFGSREFFLVNIHFFPSTLEGMDNSLRAAMIRGQKQRIKSIV